jgi:hypothetical protein
MALMKCKECGNDVSTSASVCPKCGAPVVLAPGAAKRIAKGVGYAFAGLIVLTVIGTIVGGKKPESAAAGYVPVGTPQPAQAATPALEVLAKQLHDDYVANEVSADDRYKGKTLAVGGTVASIDKDPFDNMVVKIGWPGDNSFGLEDVMAKLSDSEKPKAAKLSKGQPIAVRCTGNGMVLKSPMLSDCVVFANAK